MEFVLNERPSQDDMDRIGSKLHEYNTPFFENVNKQTLSIEAKDEAGGLAGGIIFTVWGEWLNIKLLWVDETMRGKGLGSELLLKAEEAAKSMGCDMAYLTTFSFQARPFYEKHGYKLVYVQKTFPAGIAKYHMEKSLL